MRGVFAVLLALVVVSSGLFVVVPGESSAAVLVPHDPIRIDGDADFAAMAPGNWSGAGTEGNPYVIELFDISGHWVADPI